MIPPIGLSPNIERDDVVRAWSVLFSGWNWYTNNAKNEVITWFKQKYSTRHVFLFTSARSSLTILLEAMHIGVGDEVIIQAFTCMVVPNAIRFAGATPIFVDVDDSANCDPKDIERKINSQTKAIIVQHMFGTPADMKAILAVAKKHRVTVIEDCAHALGATYEEKPIGTFGDAAFFSFGRDKCVSSVFGGAVIVKNTVVAQRLAALELKIAYPSNGWIIQQLLHPILTSLVLPLYTKGIGKVMLVVFQKLHLLSFPVVPREKAGKKPNCYMMRYPNALALLLVTQLAKLDRYVDTRVQAAAVYKRAFEKNSMITIVTTRIGSSYLRFGIRVKNQNRVLQYAKDKGIILGNWYHAVIDPVGSDMEKAGYAYGSCVHAERIAHEIVNLPTRITTDEAEHIALLVNAATKQS